ncbi:hypothetical protein JR316_0001983 [Psilocybe cubensis]|uniref:Uncharacterized protein n=1 Tax=Psilocybe cubensis TaxID=181762 RepID=A0ACB8HBP9_PSICU|nr:hypothetical protein JR316_0001983 [Psilocybe cubensis]KAH9485077.1 hypothetical protein JR316_0001983 [Psilocybe cubensis]
MYQRDPRSFAYDDQGAAYSSGHNSADYPPNGYPHPQSSGHYYAPPGHGVGGAHEGVNSGPYFRSMTPSLVAANRYPRDPRYYNQQGFGGSSSSTSQSLYASQNQPYPPQYLPTSDQRSVPLSPTPNPPAHFIPTPSEIAHNYSSYSHHLVTPHSPTSPEDQYHSSADYSSPPHIVPSSHGSQSHRLSRIATGRPQSANDFLARSVAKLSRGPTTESATMKLNILLAQYSTYVLTVQKSLAETTRLKDT